jgi:hypothetical protein
MLIRVSRFSGSGFKVTTRNGQPGTFAITIDNIGPWIYKMGHLCGNCTII